MTWYHSPLYTFVSLRNIIPQYTVLRTTLCTSLKVIKIGYLVQRSFLWSFLWFFSWENLQIVFKIFISIFIFSAFIIFKLLKSIDIVKSRIWVMFKNWDSMLNVWLELYTEAVYGAFISCRWVQAYKPGEWNPSRSWQQSKLKTMFVTTLLSLVLMVTVIA